MTSPEIKVEPSPRWPSTCYTCDSTADLRGVHLGWRETDGGSGAAHLHVMCGACRALLREALAPPPVNECAEAILAKMARDDKTLELAEVYRQATAAMPALWRAVIESYPGGKERGEAVKAHTAGRQTCQDARAALIAHVSGKIDETGANRE